MFSAGRDRTNSWKRWRLDFGFFGFPFDPFGLLGSLLTWALSYWRRPAKITAPARAQGPAASHASRDTHRGGRVVVTSN
jgi:hypothetical protein